MQRHRQRGREGAKTAEEKRIGKAAADKKRRPVARREQFKAYRKTNKNKLTAEQILDIFESKVEASRAEDVEVFRESYKVASPPPSSTSTNYKTEFVTWNGDLLDALRIKMEDNFKANSTLRLDRLAHEWMDMRQKEDEYVAGWQARVKKLVRDFSKLTPAIVKSQSDIMEKFNQGFLVMTHMGVDANNEALHMLISEAFFRQYLEPLGEVWEEISDQGIKLIGAGCDEVKSLGIINELDVTFAIGSKKRPTPHIRIKVIVLKGDFSCDVLMDVNTIRKLGMIIYYSAETPYIALTKLNPILEIELGQEKMQSISKSNSSSGTLPRNWRTVNWEIIASNSLLVQDLQ
ncbi:hypothetical protein M885DRAFT_576042 [Pelagophyceae sp. CCMP2097]|nr:hypothetical protein M885DRAFT_576042 [Pelagophyceae sp. CCMP2097]